MTHQLAVGSSALAASAWIPAAAAPSARDRPFTREPRRHASSDLVDFLGPKDGLEQTVYALSQADMVRKDVDAWLKSQP